MSNFSNYELGENVTTLANSLLPEIAYASDFDLPVSPTAEHLDDFIKHIGPAKELQQNIALVREKLGVSDDTDATNLVADWVERSGVLTPLNREFARAETQVRDEFDTVIWSGGVANWMLRRTALTERLDPAKVGRLVIPVGNRVMGDVEHQIVATLNRTMADLTEAHFVLEVVQPRLKIIGFNVEVLPVSSKDGDEVLDAAFSEVPSILDGTILVPSNAPNAIQAAGQLRLAANRAGELEDDQLFMVSDSIPVARHGEGTATHQNPFSALGQIVRNAKFLVANSQ